MKILLDECLPRRLARELIGHEAKTVQQIGWSRKTNGELLALIKNEFDVFVTIDQNLVFQQNLKKPPFAVLVLSAKTNQFEDLAPLVPNILKALEKISTGQIVHVKA